jgi:putative peptidoglycan lipid II flippase
VRPYGQPPWGTRRPPAVGESDSNLLRSSGGMALGTLASRLTGFLSNLMLAYAIGAGTLSTSYNDANTLPNVVYNLMLGGILTSVVVPLLVAAAKRDPDRGEGYFQRIFTLSVLALGAITVLATLAAGIIVGLYAGTIHGAEHRVMVLFAYFFMPQIFFYGMSSLAGAILNARGRFAAPMWTPVINNVVVIVMLSIYVALAGLGRTPQNITPGEIRLLGIGATLGIVAQSVALIPALLRCGFRPRPTFGFRRAEVAEIGRMAGWLAGYVVTTQASFFSTLVIANAASVHARSAGYPSYFYAYLLFQMPYAVVGISVITALLPRMSAHATARRYSWVRADFSTGIRLSAVIVVPSALLLAALGAPLAEFLFAHGSTSVSDAHYIGQVFAVFSLGLVPYMTFQLLLRVFYSLHDSKTPCMIGLVTMATNIMVNVIALNMLPSSQVDEGLAAGFGIANLVGSVVAWRLLLRRVGSLDGRAITRSLIKMHIAAIPAAMFAIEMVFAIGVIIRPGTAFGLITVLIGGGGGLLLYTLIARSLRVSEVTQLMAMVGARFGRRRPGQMAVNRAGGGPKGPKGPEGGLGTRPRSRPNGRQRGTRPRHDPPGRGQ